VVFDEGLIIKKNTNLDSHNPVNSSTTFPTIELQDDNSIESPVDVDETPPNTLPKIPEDHLVSNSDSKFYNSSNEFEEQSEFEINEPTKEPTIGDINSASSSAPRQSTRKKVPSQKLLKALTFIVEPFKSNAKSNSYQEAMISADSAQWKATMDDEYKSLTDNKT